MKCQKYIGICFGVWLGFLFGACSANNSGTVVTFQNRVVDNHNSNAPNMVNLRSNILNQKLLVSNENTKIVISNKNSSRTLDCGNPSEYSFALVENPEQKNNSELHIRKLLNIVIGEEVIARIELPIPDWEVKNFSLNSAEKTKAGFEIKVDWGGGKYHYEIQFNFICKDNSFYLYKVRNDNFSTTNSDSGNFLDKKETKVTQFKPSLSIEKFVMLDYLQ